MDSTSTADSIAIYVKAVAVKVYRPIRQALKKVESERSTRSITGKVPGFSNDENCSSSARGSCELFLSQDSGAGAGTQAGQRLNESGVEAVNLKEQLSKKTKIRSRNFSVRDRKSEKRTRNASAN